MSVGSSGQRDTRLGQLLVERGLVSASEVQQGLTRQVTHGGRIGSNLVELGSVSIEAVADALSIQRGVPGADLQRLQISKEALAVIPAQLCGKYKILPLRLDKTTLHLAMQDPQRNDLIAHLSEALRVRIQPYVAPQLRLLYWLERYHGLARPKRYLRDPSVKTDKRRTYLAPTTVLRSDGQDRLAQGIVGQAASGPNAAPGGSSTTGSSALAAQVSAARPETPAGETICTDTSQYELVFLDDVPRGAPAQGEADLEIDVSFETLQQESKDHVELATPDVVIANLTRARTREQVVTSLVRPVLPTTTLSLLLLPRGDLGVTLAASGTALPAQQVRALVVPLDRPSLVANALREKRAAAGDASKDSLQVMIAAYLKAPQPKWACVVPIMIGHDVANVLCVQLAAPASADATRTLQGLAESAAGAYVRLIGQQQVL